MSHLDHLDRQLARRPGATLPSWGIVRGTAAVGTLVTLGYALQMSGTALALSMGAPWRWRLQVLLLEGGLPFLFTMGFGYAAWGPPRRRRLGWIFVGVVVLGMILWTWSLHAVSDGTLVVNLNGDGEVVTVT